MKKNFFCFSRNGKYYAIDTVRIVPLQLSFDDYILLKKVENIEDNNMLVEILKNDEFLNIRSLADQDILFHNSNYIVENSFRELNISLIPTLGCNLNCKYCYSTQKKANSIMHINRINEIIEFFCENFSFSFCRVDFVSGGEPLYNSNALVDIVEALLQNLKMNNKFSLFWLCTNGTLLSNKILEYLDSKNFNIGISIDGPEYVNDANRIDLMGRGTYKKVVRNVECIIENKKLSRNIKNLWNCAVITSDTKSLVEIMEHSYKLGFRNLQMKIVWSNREDIRLSEKKTLDLYDELTQYLYILVKEDRVEEFLCICNENDTYGKILLRIIIQSGVTRRCNAGVNKFSISPDGKLYPCDSFLGLEEYCIGNIYNGFNDMYYKFSNIRNDGIEKCKTCWSKYICGGDCFYNAYLNNGTPFVPDQKVCNIMQEIIKMCVGLVVDLYCSFPNIMQRIYSILSKKTIRMEP